MSGRHYGWPDDESIRVPSVTTITAEVSGCYQLGLKTAQKVALRAHDLGMREGLTAPRMPPDQDDNVVQFDVRPHPEQYDNLMEYAVDAVLGELDGPSEKGTLLHEMINMHVSGRVRLMDHPGATLVNPRSGMKELTTIGYNACSVLIRYGQKIEPDLFAVKKHEEEARILRSEMRVSGSIQIQGGLPNQLYGGTADLIVRFPPEYMFLYDSRKPVSLLHLGYEKGALGVVDVKLTPTVRPAHMAQVGGYANSNEVRQMADEMGLPIIPVICRVDPNTSVIYNKLYPLDKCVSLFMCAATFWHIAHPNLEEKWRNEYVGKRKSAAKNNV